MANCFTMYLDHVYSRLDDPFCNATSIEVLRKEKLLLSAVTSNSKIKIPEQLRDEIDSEIIRIGRLRAISSIARAQHGDENVMELKGGSFSNLYPEGVERFQVDLDLLFHEEEYFVSAVRQALSDGMHQKVGHMVLGRDGRWYSHVCLYQPITPSGDSYPNNLYVDFHLRAIPSTPVSYIDLSLIEKSTPGAVIKATVYFIELITRLLKKEGMRKRDILDALLLFDGFSQNDSRELLMIISEYCLWPAVSLLREHILADGFEPLPHYLVLLLEDDLALPSREPNVYESHAWNYCSKKGYTRLEFDALFTGYSEVNETRSLSRPLSDFEVGIRFGRGVPVAIQFNERGGLGKELLESCSVLAGPRLNRRTVYSGIGK